MPLPVLWGIVSLAHTDQLLWGVSPPPHPDYLLSNNYVNSIIVHKFDFSDEEIMAYYISFLKTLSLKLNNHTVHFFYNEVSHSPRGVGLGSQLVRVALSMGPCLAPVGLLLLHFQ